jgi:hypothetical protein
MHQKQPPAKMAVAESAIAPDERVRRKAKSRFKCDIGRVPEAMTLTEWTVI